MTLQTLSTSLLSKANLLVSKALYFGKVGAELSKQVYVKEGLQPPAINIFKQTYINWYKSSLKFAQDPQPLIKCAQNLKKDDLIKYGAIGVQLLGFFSVGEIIGRRHVVGYKSYYHSPATH